jgi:hypothetical protein
MLLVDAHVHIYDCFDLQAFFDAAYLNFKTNADRFGHGDDFTGILLLAETVKDNWFHHLSCYAEGNDLPGRRETGPWKFNHTAEAESLCARSGDNRKLVLIAGRQIVTAERLEVLALATTATYNDGIRIKELVESVRYNDGIPVIPWGFGKWVGKRGAVVKSLLSKDFDRIFFLGDNGGRPNFLSGPRVLKPTGKNRVQILSGSDPLPFTSEYQRVGNFGSIILRKLSSQKPARDLKYLLLNSTESLEPYGCLENPIRFVLNQTKLNLRTVLKIT